MSTETFSSYVTPVGTLADQPSSGASDDQLPLQDVTGAGFLHDIGKAGIAAGGRAGIAAAIVVFGHDIAIAVRSLIPAVKDIRIGDAADIDATGDGARRQIDAVIPALAIAGRADRCAEPASIVDIGSTTSEKLLVMFSAVAIELLVALCGSVV